MTKFKCALAGMAALLAGTSADAAMRLWTINNAVFSDGGTWTGTFEWDAATGTFGDYSWTVSGGDETTFPSITYTNANALDAPTFTEFFDGTTQIHLYKFDGPSEFLDENPSAPGRNLYLSTVAALSDAGGVVQVDRVSSYAAGECWYCAPYRPLVSGFLTSGPGGVPEPANWAMMIGGIGMVGASRRYARHKTRVAFA